MKSDKIIGWIQIIIAIYPIFAKAILEITREGGLTMIAIEFLTLFVFMLVTGIGNLIRK